MGNKILPFGNIEIEKSQFYLYFTCIMTIKLSHYMQCFLNKHLCKTL